MIELLTDLLEQAQRSGASAADAFVVEDQSFSAQVRLGRVDTVKHARAQHLALRVFIGQIRRKLNDDPANPRFILTEPGVGYRFREEP